MFIVILAHRLSIFYPPRQTNLRRLLTRAENVSFTQLKLSPEPQLKQLLVCTTYRHALSPSLYSPLLPVLLRKLVCAIKQ